MKYHYIRLKSVWCVLWEQLELLEAIVFLKSQHLCDLRGLIDLFSKPVQQLTQQAILYTIQTVLLVTEVWMWGDDVHWTYGWLVVSPQCIAAAAVDVVAELGSLA
jgi:hypothetical protein